MILEPGDAAPAFQLPSTSGETVSLASLRGRKVVLYFYPKDQTPGCTREACAFRDLHAAFQRAGAAVYGVSKDSLASHEKFRAKEGLPFPLLSDPDNAVARAFGAYGTKTMYGKQVEGTIRSTFVIDEAWIVAAAWRSVKVDGHAEKVLAALTMSAAAAPAKAPAGRASKKHAS